MKGTQVKIPRLHVFLGAGGVGKTTLSAGFALSLAKSGRKVGLLSIDPAKRLQSALGVDNLGEQGVRVPLPDSDGEGGARGELYAAMLHIGESLRRWVREEGMTEETQSRLFSNNLFRAVAEKLATSTDTFAAVRMAEWPAQYGDLDDLVIDTAPGIHAIDFLAKPEKLSAFLDSKLVDWLKWFVGAHESRTNIFQKALKSGARRILDGLAQVGGQTFLLNFGEFLILLDDVFRTMMRRLEFARQWLKHPSTNFVLVTAVRDDAASVSRELGRTLAGMQLKARLVVVNRAFPDVLALDPGFQTLCAGAPGSSGASGVSGAAGVGNPAVSKGGKIKKTEAGSADAHTRPAEQRQDDVSAKARFFANHLSSFVMTQGRVRADTAPFGHSVVELPVASQLDAGQALRISDLTGLGDLLRAKAGALLLS